MEVVNLFALRTPFPTVLRRHTAPVGPENDTHVLIAADRAGIIVAAWGNWGNVHGRDREILNRLRGRDLLCLGHTGAGRPRHPLYLPAGTPLVPFDRPASVGGSLSATVASDTSSTTPIRSRR